MSKSYFNKHSSNSSNSFDKKKYSTTFRENCPSTSPNSYIDNNKSNNIYSSSNNSGFFQTVKDGFGLGIGSSVGQLMTYSILGGPKVNVEHTHVNNNNINPCINNNNDNCSNILLELEKCKNDFNCNFDKLDKLKNDYEKCKNLI